MVEVSNNFIQECEANVGTYKFGKIKVNYIDDNPFNYEQGAYSSSNGTKIDAEQSIRYNKLVECEPNFKYKIELGNSQYKMKIVTYNANQAFIAVHDNLIEGSELTTEATAKYISVTIYSNDTLEGTVITLNSTIRNGEIAGAELQGDTTQNGTPTPTTPIEVNNVTGLQKFVVGGDNYFDLIKLHLYATNNLTYSIEDSGNIEVAGDGTSGGYKCIIFDLVLPNGNYTFSCNIEDTDTILGNVGVGIDVFQKESTTRETWREIWITPEQIESGTRRSNTVTIDNLTHYYRLKFYINQSASVSGSESNIVHFQNIMFAKGTDTEYKEYKSKDYEINLGKNLLQYNNFTDRTVNGITITNNNDGTFLLNGTATADVSLAIDPDNFIPMTGKWKMIGCPSGGSSSTYMLSAYVGYWGGVSPNIDTGNGTEITYTGNVKVRFYIKSGTTCNNLLFKPMITYDLNATYEDFSPYFTPIELNKIGNYQDSIKKGTGKNLFDKNNANILNGWLDNNKMALSPTQLNRLFYIPCKANTTYTISRSILTSAFRVATYDSEPFPIIGSSEAQYNISGLIKDNSATSITITTGANAKYLIVHYGRLETDLNIEESLKTIQIEENTQATSFEPFGYKDKWYIEKNVGKVVLNGTENWSLNSNYTNNVFYIVVDNINKTSNVKTILSNYYNGVENQGLADFGNNYNYSICSRGYNDAYYHLYISNDSISSVADFKTWLQSNNTKVYYALASSTYTLIENEELIKQLDAVSHAETQEGTTNITSSGILPATLEVTPNLIESIRGKQTTPIVGYNITGDDDLINFKITSKADSNGNILGATSQSQVDIEIFNENNTHNLENKQVYISTGLNETEGNYCKWQPFTITQTKDTQTKNHTTYTGYDDMMRGNEAYIDNVDYGEEGITLYDFTCKLAKEMGMALGNTTMTNGDFIVKGNNFTNNEAKLVVLKNVAQMAGGFAMIDRDNLLRIVELSPEEAMTPIELTTNLYTEDFQNSAKFGEINEFAIGETNIETNAIVRSDDASIAKNGVKKIEILDNIFLGLLEDKELAIEPLWDAFEGFSYYPFKTPYNGYPYLDLGDKVNITDINSNVYGTLVLNNVFEYNGGYKGNIGAEALSITAAKYKTTNTLSKQFRKVGIDIDRVEGKITSEIDAATDGITKAYNTAISQTKENINLSVTEINKVLSGDPAVEGDTGLEGTVNKINQTYLTVNSNDFVVVSSTATEAKKKADAVDENTQKIVSQLHFDAETGLTISAEGSTDDDMKLNLTNSQVNFMYRNSPVLVINGNKIEFTGATFQKFDLGNYVWQAEDDDSLSLIYEGD